MKAWVALFLLGGSVAHASLRGVHSCVDSKLARFLSRASPLEAEREFHVPVPRAVHRLDEVQKAALGGKLLGHSFRGEPLELSVVSPGEFLGAFGKLRGKGFWILMTPAEPGARAAAGHAWIATGDTFFDRYGPWIVRSQDARHLAVGGEPQVSIERAYAIAQFFEVSEGSLNQLDHFMHDRVWQFNAGVGSYQPRFTERPLSHPHAGHWEENCLVFAYSWLFPEWKALRPEVQGVQVEFGDVRLSEVPSQQVFLNAEVPSYRGTLLISGHPEQALRHLREDGWNRDEAGRQLLFAEPLTPIGP